MAHGSAYELFSPPVYIVFFSPVTEAIKQRQAQRRISIIIISYTSFTCQKDTCMRGPSLRNFHYTQETSLKSYFREEKRPSEEMKGEPMTSRRAWKYKTRSLS